MKKPESNVATSSKIRFESDDDEGDDDVSSSSEDEVEIENALADFTFEELQKARIDGSQSFSRKAKEEKLSKRANKHRPMEVSSKKPVPRLREVVQVPKRVVRDPRFESLCGTLNSDGFRKRYNFLFEDNLPAEKEALRKKLKSTKDAKEMEEMKERISWINKQLKPDSTRSIDAKILSDHKKKEREAAEQGKRPFYLKKSEIRKKRQIEKFKELKASGKLEAFIEKRRKKNAAKDHRYMPYRRNNED